MKYYEIIFPDSYIDDNGSVQHDVVQEVVSEDKLEWYKKHCNLYSIKEVKFYKQRKVLMNIWD